VRAVFRSIVPGWDGSGLPAAFPLRVRFALRLSLLLVFAASLLWKARFFGSLSVEEREAIVSRFSRSRLAVLRSLFNWWKLAALVTDPRIDRAPSPV